MTFSSGAPHQILCVGFLTLEQKSQHERAESIGGSGGLDGWASGIFLQVRRGKLALCGAARRAWQQDIYP